MKVCTHITGYLIVFALLSFLYTDSAFALSITDQSGKQIHFDKPFQRIISLYPAHTENLASLALDQQIIGISTSDDYPDSFTSKPRFSYKDNPEKFIAASPDLVLIRPMIEHGYPEFIGQLRNAGITVISLQPTSVDTMYEYWMKLGKLTGKAREAELMVHQFQSALAQQKKLIETIPLQKRPKVYFESIHKKMKTFSPVSIPIFCLENGGGINVAIDAKPRRASNIAAYGKEKILSHGHEIEVFLAQIGRMNRVDFNTIEQEPGFKAIQAVRNKKIFLVDEKIVSRPTIRLLNGIKTIYNILYRNNMVSAKYHE